MATEQSPLDWPDATDLATRIASRELSALEALETYEARIDAENPRLNAVVTRNPEAAAEAASADRDLAQGRPRGPLHGVPFTVKDSFDAEGLRATRGSALFADHVAPADATAVRRLRDAGAILLGKTNVPEFTIWAETDNLVFGPTVHPLDAARTPGGSSGGEAAAIAASLSPLGIGSDVAGSIRLPAHYCGIVGFKPTHGRVPLSGHWPAVLERFTDAGPIARSVRDARLALAAMGGPDGRDWQAEFGPVRALARRPVGELRVGYLAGDAFGPLEPDVATNVAMAAEALRTAAASVEQVSIAAIETCDYDTSSLSLYAGGAGPYFEEAVAGRPDRLHPVIRERLARPAPSLELYLGAQRQVERLRAGLLDYFARFDALLCPVAPVVAPPRGQADLDIAGERRRARSVLRATLPFNLAGTPALSVPFGRSREGLPIGVQLVGRWGDDATLLDLGQVVQDLGAPA